MSSEWSDIQPLFEAFFASKGLREIDCQTSAAFGDRVIVYGDGNIAVRIGSDRMIPFTDIAEVVTQPKNWYDIMIIREFLAEGEFVAADKQLAMPFAEQLQFIEGNWDALKDAFAAPTRTATHETLAVLRKERAKRLFPRWFGSDDPE